MNRSELNDKAKKYISNAGFGTGTNITLHGLKCMIVDFYLDNQGQTLPIDNVRQSDSLTGALKDGSSHIIHMVYDGTIKINECDLYVDGKLIESS
jgi:hypothetical protein